MIPAIDKSQSLAEALRLRRFFLDAGAELVDAHILQPAGTLLDLYGEDIRARAYVTQDPERGEMMLRPDFTVPVVQQHMDAGAAPARYTYLGEVFRKQEEHPERPSEYLQVGFELFDDANPARADAEVFALFAEALADLGLRPATGDFGILIAAIDGLSLSAPRRAALMRHLWRPRRFRKLVERFAGKRTAPPRRAAVVEAYGAGGDPLADAGPFIGLRSRDEVLGRLDRLVADAAEPPLPAAELELLDHILDLKDMCPAALEQLRDITVDLPALQSAVQRFEQRLDAMSARGIAVDALPFEASFGRTTLEYYDGFVFGFAAPDMPGLPHLATGGRYDALTRVLGRGREMPAVGGMVRPETVLALRELRRNA
ncbi:MAG: ATP phosphoribosyltransferase regulatory subunit [Rhodobacteraceae bacterium]|nr:ATP phosphoribosyltransferase regulatory subunit [Paracoccaceae bacterium]